MTYKIISSGSKGNAVVINDVILIDCGVSFKKLDECKRGLKLVLLTHKHSDHFNKRTIRMLAKDRPTLRFACGGWLVPELLLLGVDKRNIDVVLYDQAYDYAGFMISPLELVHDVPNCGWWIRFKDERKEMMYATDTKTLSKVKNMENLDLYLIEGNYTGEDILERIKAKKEAGEYCYEERAREMHLSVEKAEEFLLKNAGFNSKYELIHRHKED